MHSWPKALALEAGSLGMCKMCKGHISDSLNSVHLSVPSGPRRALSCYLFLVFQLSAYKLLLSEVQLFLQSLPTFLKNLKRKIVRIRKIWITDKEKRHLCQSNSVSISYLLKGIKCIINSQTNMIVFSSTRA